MQVGPAGAHFALLAMHYVEVIYSRHEINNYKRELYKLRFD